MDAMSIQQIQWNSMKLMESDEIYWNSMKFHEVHIFWWNGGLYAPMVENVDIPKGFLVIWRFPGPQNAGNHKNPGFMVNYNNLVISRSFT